MLWTQVYLTEQELTGIATFAMMTGRKQSEIIREAIDAFLEAHKPGAVAEAVQHCQGIWRDRIDLPDFCVVRESFDRY